jgi:hypothetical protein
MSIDPMKKFVQRMLLLLGGRRLWKWPDFADEYRNHTNMISLGPFKKEALTA